MNKLLLSVLAAGIAATAFASPSAPTVQLNESASLVPQIRLADGFSLLPIDRNAFETPTQKRVTRAEGNEQSVDFSLAYNVATAAILADDYGQKLLTVGSTYYQAFELSEYNRGLYAGKTITAINIAAPVNSSLSQNSYVNDITDVTVFLTHDLEGEFFYEQKGTLGRAGFEMNKIVLDTPYVIEADKPLYIGYYAKLKSTNDFYLVVDGLPRETPDGGHYAYVKGSAEPQWGNIAGQYGNLCIGATIEGENLPKDGASIYGIELPEYAEPGKPFNFDIAFAGEAVNNAESVEIEYTVGDQAPQTVTIPFEEKYYLGYHQLVAYTIPNVISNVVGIEVPFSVRVTKVNGNPNLIKDNVATGDFQCFDSKLGFKHNFVVEEGTGTWCGWCPRGLVLMEYIKNTYPDDFIRVALHSDDQMAGKAIDSVLGLFAGFPSAIVDRKYDPFAEEDFNAGVTEYYEAHKDIPSMADVNLEVEVESGAKSVTISTDMKFAVDMANDDRYRIAYYIVENNVGPYKQNNSYSGGRYGKMGGWETKPSSVETMYEDVARRLVGTVTGLKGSIPTELKAGETYNYTGKAGISEVKNDEFLVVAMVVDSKTYRIVNAKQVKAYKSSAVETVTGDASDIKVFGGNGEVTIAGAYENAAVYDVAGRLVATGAGEASVSVPSGIYIVKADNVAAKVVVR